MTSAWSCRTLSSHWSCASRASSSESHESVELLSDTSDDDALDERERGVGCMGRAAGEGDEAEAGPGGQAEGGTTHEGER